MENKEETKIIETYPTIFSIPTLQSVIPPNSNHKNFIIAKPDSGATGNYFRSKDAVALSNLIQKKGPSVTLPNKEVIHSSFSGHLPLQGLTSKATETHIFNELQSASLISVGKLCNDGCTVTFNKEKMQATKNNTLILQGDRNPSDGLWDIKLPCQPAFSPTKQQHLVNTNVAHVIIRKTTSKTDLIQFYQACCYSPTKSTWHQAVKNGNFITWPGLTPDTVAKYYTDTVYTAKGHLDQERKNLHSTKLIKPLPLTPAEEFLLHNDHFPNDEKLTKPTNNCMSMLVPFQAKETGYSDLTGRFPFTSSRGYQYLLIMYDYDSNGILAEPTKSKQGAELKTAFIKLYQTLASRGAAPSCYICDNECSSELK